MGNGKRGRTCDCYEHTSRFPGSGETVLLCWSFVGGVPVTGVREEGEGGGGAGRRASSGRESVCVYEGGYVYAS